LRVGRQSQHPGTVGRGERGVRQREPTGDIAHLGRIVHAVIIGVGQPRIRAIALFFPVREPVAVAMGIAVIQARHGLRVVRIGARAVLIPVVETIEIRVLVGIADAVAISIGIERIQAVGQFPGIRQSIAVRIDDR